MSQTKPLLSTDDINHPCYQTGEVIGMRQFRVGEKTRVAWGRLTLPGFEASLNAHAVPFCLIFLYSLPLAVIYYLIRCVVENVDELDKKRCGCLIVHALTSVHDGKGIPGNLSQGSAPVTSKHESLKWWHASKYAATVAIFQSALEHFTMFKSLLVKAVCQVIRSPLFSSSSLTAFCCATSSRPFASSVRSSSMDCNNNNNKKKKQTRKES